MFSWDPSWLANDHPGPSAPLPTGPSDPTVQLILEPVVVLGQTLSEAVNRQKLGSGQAQFVSSPPATGEPVEAPTSMFSVASSVGLAPSSRFFGLVWMSHG